MEGFLKHQKSPINRSLTKLDNVASRSTPPRSLSFLSDFSPTLASEAIISFKSLLGYCGDKAVSFPASQGLDFVMLGIKKAYLRNELYLQAIKQTISAPSSYTQCRAFHLLCLLSDAFTPSSDFYCYVVNYLLSHTDKSSSTSVSSVEPLPIQQMASYCLARLQSLKLLPLDKHLLDIPVETVEAYSARLPTIAPIHTPDGALLGELLVAPDVGIERLMKTLCALLHIHESRSGVLGLYVVTSKSSDLAPMILLPDRDFFLGDISQPPLLQKFGRPIRYYVKRKILQPSCLDKFSWPSSDDEAKETRGEREALVDLTFQQLSSRVRADEIRVTEETVVAHLAAIQLATEAQFRPGSVAIALGQGCLNYISETHLESYPPETREEHWGRLVAQELYKCVDKTDHQLKEEYVGIVSSLPFGQMQTYICLKGSQTTATVPLPLEIFLGIDETGLHFHDAASDSPVPVLVLRYVDIKSFGVKLNSIRFVLEGATAAAGGAGGGGGTGDKGKTVGSYQIELITPLNEEVSQYCLLYRPVQQLETQFSRFRPAPSSAAKPAVSIAPSFTLLMPSSLSLSLTLSLSLFLSSWSLLQPSSQSRLQKLATSVTHK
jgi:hypothetical protein